MGLIEHYYVKQKIRKYFKEYYDIELDQADEQNIMTIIEDNHKYCEE